ncbi:retrovirus-related pol polyprotein from transposon TNT 1-94 [Tanacetum coccineum]
MVEKRISWIAWDKAISPISKGGLGIGDLKSSNLAMLIKWWWRFHTEDQSLWCQVIRSIHGGSHLKATFPRLFCLETEPSCLVRDRTPSYLSLNTTTAPLTIFASPTTPGSPLNTSLVFKWAWNRPIRSEEELNELSCLASIAETNDDEGRQKENQKRYAKALFFIQQAADESIFSRIAATTTSNQAWMILKTEYQGSTKVITLKLQSLRRDFKTSGMKGNESVQDYLTPKFDHVVAAIEESKDLSIMSFDEITGEKYCWFKPEEANYAEEDEEQDDYLFMVEAKTGNKTSDVLYLDNGHGSAAVNIGHKEKYMRDIRYAPYLAHNLLSVGQLMASGYPLKFDDGKCIIKNKATREFLAYAYMMKNIIIPLDFSTKMVLINKNLKESELWHLRYGHLKHKGFQLSKSKEMVFYLPSNVSLKQVCKGCVLGRQTRSLFQVRKSKRAEDLLELVHSDLCGPMRTNSLAESRYFLLFTDDYSRMSWVYLKLKFETFELFKNFKALVEKQTRKNLKVLRTDRGGEFLSKEFAAYRD